MIEDRSVIMIGATGRNSGKTTLATQIIDRYKDRFNIIGLKVTTIATREAICPRSTEGCGTCTSLSGDYAIGKEMGEPTEKDTSKMLYAGCSEVYWIRCHREYLPQAYREFKTLVPDDSLIVCESNSLRKHIDPLIFIMIKNTGDDFIKPTAKEVIHLSDAVIEGFYTEDDHEITKLLDEAMKERWQNE